jgi:hypothetical protein
VAITVGSVEVDVIPNTQGIYQRLKDKLVPEATRAGEDAGDAAGRAFGPSMQGAVGNAIGERIGQQIGEQIASRITSTVRDSLRDGVTQGGRTARPAATRQGDETAGAFARAMRARLEAAFRSMPRLDVGLNDTGVDADLARLRARMETLAGKRIGVDVDVEAAQAEIADIEERLGRLGATHANPVVRADTARARAELAAMREEMDRLTANPVQVRVEADGSFATRLRAAVQAAESSLPAINVDANTTPAEAELVRLRAQLTQLGTQRVGVDIDAATAMARIEEIQARLQRLAASDADVAVRVDAAAATAQLAQVQAMASALDGKTARIDVDTSGALSAVFQLSVAIAGLAAIPAIPVLASGAGGLAASFVAAGVGVGAFAAAALPALTGIKAALDAQKQAQTAAMTATTNAAQSSAQAARRSLQLAGAQQALATAERNGARQIAQAQQQVVQAKQAAAQAVAQAAQRNEQAARAVQDAEKQLAASQKDARQAQLDLTAARREAGQELQDLANQYADAQLSQRDAALAVQEAQLELNQVNAAGSKASVLERQRAQLAYDQAVQRLKEQKTETQRLAEQQAEADKTGVEGTDTFKQAQDRLAQAQQAVSDRAQAVRDAQAEAARVQVETAQQVAQAQQRVSEATANVAVAQQNAADAVTSAQRQIQSAQLSTTSTANTAATAQAKYQAALEKLSPSARRTFDAFLHLRTAFGEWSKSLQPAVMPIFTKALDGIRKALPGLTPFVVAAADAIGKLQDKVSEGFKSPWWKSFKRDLQGSVIPAIIGVGVSFGRIFKGIVGIIDGFLPHMGTISETMQRITGRFSDWATGLKGSPEFEGFLSYAAQQAPILADALGRVFDAFFQVSKAVAPLSGPVLEVLGALADGVGWLAVHMPGFVQLMYGLFVATRLYALAQAAANVALLAYRGMVVLAILLTQGWAAAIAAANLAFEANPVVAVITIIVVALVALVAGIIYAWNHWGWFRDAVLAVWGAIQTAAMWAWTNVLQPVFSALWGALQTVGRWAMWLWTNAIGPAFRFIWEAAKILVTAVIVLAVLPIIAAFKLFGLIGRWLWEHVIRPVFRAIGTAAVWLYQNIIKPNFLLAQIMFRAVAAVGRWLWNNALGPAFRAIGAAAKWLYDKAIRPAFGWIADKAKWLWAKAIKPQFDALKRGVDLVGKAFSTAKDYIGSQWAKVADLAKKPIKFVIQTVYNAGIVPLWNKVADVVGAKKLQAMSLKGWATGGVLPGYTPGRDVHTFVSPTGGALALSGGEAVMRPEFTRAVGPATINALNAAARSGGVAGVQRALGFADGGILGSILGGIKNTVSTGFDWAKKGADLLLNPGKVFTSLMDPVKKLINRIGESQWAQLAAKMPLSWLSGLKKKVIDLVGLGGSTGVDVGGSGVRRWSGVVRQALALVNQPASMVDLTLRRMNQESGGNPRAVNLWDSNAKAGYPSTGLMQVIRPTFQHYAGRFRNKGPFMYGVSIDPLANIYASMRYALSAYGSLPAAYNRAGGYDSGGYLQPGLNLAYNGTGRPEPVFTTQQANALIRMGTDPGLSGPAEMTGTLVLDSGELMGTFRGVVRQENAVVYQALGARPRG